MTPSPRTRLDPARLLAYDALLAVESEGGYLNLVLSRLLGDAALDARDAAFATELASGTTRLRGRYDAILATAVSAGLASLQPPVLAALRLGCHQLLAMRVPAHAAVGTTVELVRLKQGERPVRMVNAVLRRVAATPLDGWLDEVAPLSGDPGHERAALATRWSHPGWIVDAFADALAADGAPPEELADLLAADDEPPAVTLVARPGWSSRDDLAAVGAEPTTMSPYGAVLASGDPGAIPHVRSGRVGVQDEGSQLAALALARASLEGPDRRWLDMCAGPGGKAALLSAVGAERGATLVAVERAPHRAALVVSALRAARRPGLVAVADSTYPPWRADTFDRVLLDAPCTGLGALRRRPDARWRRTPDDVAALVALQRRLLAAALDATRPGGVVAYVTCSPHLAETRGVVDEIIAARADVTEEDARALLPEAAETGPGPHLQLWPHRHRTDAMFVAILRRRDGR